jgi:hypothetical protein
MLKVKWRYHSATDSYWRTAPHCNSRAAKGEIITYGDVVTGSPVPSAANEFVNNLKVLHYIKVNENKYVPNFQEAAGH